MQIQAQGRRSGTRRRFSLTVGTQGTLVGLVVLCILFSLLTPYFLTFNNFLNILDQVTVLGIMSIGMTAVTIIAGIDLSVGSVIALTMMTLGVLNHDLGWPFAVAAVAGVVAGGLSGLVAGGLITYARLPDFIATLALMSVDRGIANLLTGGQQVIGYPGWFTSLSAERHLGFLSMTTLLFILIAIASGVYLHFRTGGRQLYVIGGSKEVARLAGINVKKATIVVYVASGLLSGVAAITLAARMNASLPSAGLGYELDAIAAVVIGGASLFGGVGTITGTVIGVLIIGVLRNGLNLMGVSPFFQEVVIGAVVAAAVALDTLGKKEA
ncbi:MAG: ABC transporter permease [Gemmataceae bacterium]